MSSILMKMRILYLLFSYLVVVVVFFFQADEGDSGSGSLGFRMPTSKKGSAAVAGFTLKF